MRLLEGGDTEGFQQEVVKLKHMTPESKRGAVALPVSIHQQSLFLTLCLSQPPEDWHGRFKEVPSLCGHGAE